MNSVNELLAMRRFSTANKSCRCSCHYPNNHRGAASRCIMLKSDGYRAHHNLLHHQRNQICRQFNCSRLVDNPHAYNPNGNLRTTATKVTCNNRCLLDPSMTSMQISS